MPGLLTAFTGRNSHERSASFPLDDRLIPGFLGTIGLESLLTATTLRISLKTGTGTKYVFGPRYRVKGIGLDKGLMEPVGEAAKLVVTEGTNQESIVELGDLFTIGRSPSNSLVLTDNLASRNHAEIRHVGQGRYRLSDVGSSNGTWLNGRRLTIPRDLEHGDQILIGSVQLRFVAPRITAREEPSLSTGTALFLRNELIIVMVADIRNYTSMSEVLPNREFSLLISDWFRESSEVIQDNGGTVDKFIGDAVMAYWVGQSKSNPSGDVNASLNAARGLFARAADFSNQLSSQFPGYSFSIGIGMNMGDAMLGNVGTGENQSFTVVGDSVNVAFRLEALTKQKGVSLIASQSIVDYADTSFRFRSLGQAEVKGRQEPVTIYALELVDPAAQ